MSLIPQKDFLFGIEAEFVLVDAQTFSPLWHEDLIFEELNSWLEEIPVNDFSSDGLNIKPLHKKAIPYLVEGYYVTDQKYQPVKLLPKGVEIRTPTNTSIKGCLESLSELHCRMQTQLQSKGLLAVSLSHHPTKTDFTGPQCYERYDWWQWAMHVMSTYGPDINISLPDSVSKGIDLDDLARKVNYYAPAMTALTLNSPLANGGLWRIRGQVGKSFRTYRRSLVAPPMTIHKKPSLRFELKCLEMSNSLVDYENYFLMWLSFLFDKELPGRASDQSRVYDLGQVARLGLSAETIRQRAVDLLSQTEKIAKSLGMNTASLDTLWQRLETGRLPADDVIDLFRREKSIEGVLRHYTTLRNPHALPKADLEIISRERLDSIAPVELAAPRKLRSIFF